METPRLRALVFTARISDFGKLPKNRVQKPTEPDTFSLPMLADTVHAVIPIARPHQWQTVASHRETSVYCASAMLKQRRADLRNARLEIGLVLAFGQYIYIQE